MPVIRDHDPPLWRTIVTSIDMETLTCLDGRSTGRQMLFTLDNPAYFRCQVASDDVEVNLPWPNLDDPSLVTNNRRFLYAFRRERSDDPEVTPPWMCRFGGIIIPVEDEIADAPTTTLTAYDPWQLLMSRPARNTDTGALIGEEGLTYQVGALASDIALSQLLMTESFDGDSHIYSSSLFIEDSVPFDEPFTVEQGASVGEVWQDLCQTGFLDIRLVPIYEPFLNPGKVATLYIDQFAGATKFDSVMAWDKGPRSLVSMSRLVDRMANKVRFYTGGAAVTTHTQTDAGSVTDNGQWWAQQVVNASTHPQFVDLAALAELFIRRYGQRTISFQPVSEESQMLPLVDYGLGDYVPVWASRNFREPVSVDYDAYTADPTQPGAAGYQRIYGLPIELDDNGAESVPGIITSPDAVTGA
jgi:hypothetical protein